MSNLSRIGAAGRTMFNVLQSGEPFRQSWDGGGGGERIIAVGGIMRSQKVRPPNNGQKGTKSAQDKGAPRTKRK